eukprot:COSAG01_NODE_148_length_24037_cov_219.235859_12_plen_375_part_00
MRGSSRSLPSYSKHKASGQAVVRLSGRDIYLGPYGTKASKSEYDRLTGEWLANGRRLPLKIDDKPISLIELTADYLKYAKTYYVKNGKQTDEIASIKISIRHLNNLYGKTLAEDFGPLALIAVRNQMIETGNSRGYINNNVNRIRRMFKWAVSNEIVPVHVYQALATVPGLKKGKTSAVEKPPVMPVDAAAVAATINWASPVVADMIQFQQLTGCRPDEVCSIKPLEVDRRATVWQYFPESHKMEHKGRTRVILIGPKAQKILLPYLLTPVGDFCFQKPTGGKFERWNYREKINQACDKAFPAPAGITGEALKSWRKQHRWAPNRLRHSRATAIREQYGLEAAQAVLGHSSVDVTQIYAERDIAKAAKIMGEVG